MAMAFTANRQGWGFIDNSGWIEFTVSNNGTGAGTAFDLTVLAGFSSGGSTYYPNADWINEIGSSSVNGNYLLAGFNYAAGALNGQYAHYTTLQFPFDPDGAGVGLELAETRREVQVEAGPVLRGGGRGLPSYRARASRKIQGLPSAPRAIMT